MQTKRALQWAGVYFGAWLGVTVVSLAIVIVGLALEGPSALGLSQYNVGYFQGGTAYPKTGAALIVLGVLIWKFGTTAAFFRTVVTAIETEMASAVDTESMKSDILSVLDDRLADMHQDLSQTRQLVNRMGREEAAEDFEFEGFEDFE